MAPIGRLPPDFVGTLLTGLAVNFEIAAIALALGLVIGGGLAFARLCGRFAASAARPTVGLMRAAPSFVVMFFLLNALPHGRALPGIMIVALSLVPYAAAYVADCGLDALREWRAGSRRTGLLILPNIARAFLVLVMSSSAGAAIGVPEGIAVILRQAERTPSLGARLLLFAVGIACFGIPLQVGFAVIRLIQHRLGHAMLGRHDDAATGGISVAAE